MIRVLRIIARLNVGGPAMHATLLAERLDRARYESHLATGQEERTEGNYLELHGRTLENLHVVPGLGREIKGAQDLGALMSLVRLTRRLKPDIVDTHTAKAGTLGRLAAWLCRVPVVVHTYHGHVLHGYFSPGKTRVFVGIERALARVSDQLVAVTPQVRDELLERRIGTPDQYSVVPLGFDLDSFAQASRGTGLLGRELELSEATKLVAIVARLVPIKAHEVFLDAARRLAASRSDVHFVIVGDGERRAELERHARDLGIAPLVSFLGWRADLANIYSSANVVALTSRNEGSPVALIEAMATGCPVVSTRVGGVPDVVADGETGLLVPMDDAAGMATAIGRLLDDKALAARLGEAARADAHARYGAARMVNEMDALFTRLLDRRRA